MLCRRVLDPTRDKLDDAFTVRHIVFNEQEGLLNSRDEDEYDYLCTTRHLVVYVDSRPVATARLLLPNCLVAEARGTLFGLALEELFELSPVTASGLRPAESGRIAVMREHRKHAVTGRLLAGLYSESRQANVDVWVAVANGQTTDASEAELIHQVAAERELNGPWTVKARRDPTPPTGPSATVFQEKDWEFARRKEFQRLELPEVLSFFLLHLHARTMGSPVYLPGFNRFSFPLSCVLEEIPPITRKWLIAR